MENKVTLTIKDQHKLKMVIDYGAGKVAARRAADLHGLSKRQFRRLMAAYRQRGIVALAHGNRCRAPANHISEQVRHEIPRSAVEIYRQGTFQNPVLRTYITLADAVEDQPINDLFFISRQFKLAAD